MSDRGKRYQESISKVDREREYTPADAFARAEHLAEGLPAGKWANMAFGNLARLFPAD